MERKTLNSVNGNESLDYIYSLDAYFNETFYKQRTNRNIGWITIEEQEILRNSTVAIAGCGGMGGLLASILLRLGIRTLKIADPELFDESNINRQFGAGKSSLGKSKALITAKLLREIADDTNLIIYPMGINNHVVEDFVSGADLVCDEIEFWAHGARLSLHEKSRKFNIPILSANTVGHQTNLFYFDPKGESLESKMNCTIEKGNELQELVKNKKIDGKSVLELISTITSALIPSPPNYGYINEENKLISENVLDRLKNEMSASIIATNPPFAAGFLANHVLFQLLKKSGAKRDIVYPPNFPGYLCLDSGNMTTKIKF